MEKIIWDDTFETGIDIIDFQHRIMIERINDIIELHELGETQEHLFSLIIFLEEYSKYHFESEEEIFKKFNYSSIANHIAEHNYFRFKVQEFKEQYDNNQTIIDEELLSFLTEWIVSHILGTDKKMAKEFTVLVYGEVD